MNLKFWRKVNFAVIPFSFRVIRGIGKQDFVVSEFTFIQFKFDQRYFSPMLIWLNEN